MAERITSIEQRRGCGFRKPSKSGVGIYLVGPDVSAPCGRLPFPLQSCPCCGGGIKPARSWTWITPKELLHPPEVPFQCKRTEGDFAQQADFNACFGCPMGRNTPSGQHGLLWIGEKFYPTPTDFVREARMMGVSRKVGAIPRGFVLGETVVYLAHRKAVPIFDEDDPRMEPGIFSTFKPTAVDLVVNDLDGVPDRAERLAARIEADKTSDTTVRIIEVVQAHQTEVQTG